jgi:signal transduction histidine kinase
MRERLQMVGGKFSIKSTTGHGITVTARIPATTEGTKMNGEWSSKLVRNAALKI